MGSASPGCQPALEHFRELLDVVGPERGRRDERQGHDRRGRLAPQAPQLALLHAHDAVAAAHGSRARNGTRSPARDDAGDLGAREPPRPHRVEHDRVESRPSARAARSSSSSVSLTGISSERATATIGARARVVEQRGARARACEAIGPDAGDLGETCGASQQREPVAGRGRVDHDRS